ncbi:hypothetical protein CLOSTASPAR_03817 [[Clostridium] asparagiforme DSM 15981]|uniref:Uncharacterized protein n=1 Tax=[Clostridium] asparagiforme DSM 15981 TaxID=518636 RepID=C0D3H6_9FIRM|nr:hypothetical protein CLOSTASPAR_03817 [[Clostridium] asparagiforme DSM 15981]
MIVIRVQSAWSVRHFLGIRLNFVHNDVFYLFDSKKLTNP